MLTTELKRQRVAERNRRRMEARRRALTTLAGLYPSQFATLQRVAYENVNQERGPLPGDDVLLTTPEGV